LSIKGSPEVARRTSAKVLFSKVSFQEALPNADSYKELMFGYLSFILLQKIEKQFHYDKNNRYGVVNFGSALRYGKYAVLYAVKALHWQSDSPKTIDNLVEEGIYKVLSEWLQFEDYARNNKKNYEYFRKSVDEITEVETLESNFDSYYKVSNVTRDIKSFFNIAE
jgi:hypothetical protein